MKKMFLFFFGALFVSGCVNLKALPPLPISSAVTENVLKMNVNDFYAPTPAFYAALEQVIISSKTVIQNYQDELFPLFNKIYQLGLEKEYLALRDPIERAQEANKKWFREYIELRKNFKTLGKANEESASDAEFKTAINDTVSTGIKFSQQVMDTQKTISEYLDISLAFVVAREEKNLLFAMSSANQERFNKFAIHVNEKAKDLNREAEAFIANVNKLRKKGDAK